MSRSGIMHNFKGKTIILGAPTDFNFSGIIERELRYLGFKVINISYNRASFKYKNIFERLKSYIHKNFLGQKDYKEYLRSQRAKEETLKRLKSVHYSDYALLIRPDQYSPEVVNTIKGKALKISGYQWDGLGRYPAIFKYIDLFDRFFAFDPDDTATKNILPVTNFFTSSFRPYPDPAVESDAYYVGTYIKERAPLVEEIITALQDLSLSVKYHICYRRDNHQKFPELETTKEILSYAQNLHFAYNTKILVDVPTNVHKGLSFRTFEAIGYGKKLITTNRDVLQYDFYHPNNIFIWGNHHPDDLNAFLRAPFVPFPKEIKEKYSFANWISYVLGEEECQTIELPGLEMAPALAY